MKIPYVEVCKNFDELVAMVMEPETFKERVRQIQEMQKWVNERLGAIGTLEDVPRLLAEAGSKQTEAEDMRKAAQKALADAQAEAAAIKAKAEGEIAEARARLDKDRQEVEFARAVVGSDKQAADNLRDVSNQALTEAKQTMDRAQKMMDDAVALKNKFSEKLKQLQAVTA